MNALADFIDAAGGMVTVMSICFAFPSAHDNVGCKTLWQKAGSHMTECRLEAMDTHAYPSGKGDRLRCDVTPMETTLATILMKREAQR